MIKTMKPNTATKEYIFQPRSQGLSFASRRSKKDPGNEVVHFLNNESTCKHGSLFLSKPITIFTFGWYLPGHFVRTFTWFKMGVIAWIHAFMARNWKI
jgi:hypothetical protein